jgi:hypothetical protein
VVSTFDGNSLMLAIAEMQTLSQMENVAVSVYLEPNVAMKEVTEHSLG